MAAPFVPQPAAAPNRVQRWLGREPKKNAIVDIRNLLAQAPRVSGVQDSDIHVVSETYDVDPCRTFPAELEAIYGEFLSHCLKDKVLSGEELSDLRHLKRLFALSDVAVERVHERVVGEVYQEGVAEAVADDRLSADERTFLARVQTELRLAERVRERITPRPSRSSLAAALGVAPVDEPLSEEEKTELQALARSFGVELDPEGSSQATLDRWRRYWLLENADLPQVPAGIKLVPGEICYARRQVYWYDLRALSDRDRYGGASAWMAVAAGLSPTTPPALPRPTGDKGMRMTGSGWVFLTNRRLALMGRNENVELPLSKIRYFIPLSNGIEVQTDRRRGAFLEFGADVDLFALTLRRALREAPDWPS